MNLKLSAFPIPPTNYDHNYMLRLVRQLQIMVNQISSQGPLTAGSDLSFSDMKHPISALTLINLPTSPDGLPSGSVWNDAGTLKIVS